ncbi:MAG TPA: hypothetical protein VFU36_11040 [Jatrophihabitans sp.]|nr:hypothetical protein [Jatrophihabitans sp.]
MIVIALLSVLTSCVSPAIDSAGYRDKVGHAAEKMTGIIGSAQLAAEQDLAGKAFGTYADQVISDAEQDAQSVVGQLDSVQPPDEASITLRNQADDVLQNAAGQLSDLRIAQRRGDKAGMRQSLKDLSDSLAKVQQLQDSA